MLHLATKNLACRSSSPSCQIDNVSSKQCSRSSVQAYGLEYSRSMASCASCVCGPGTGNPCLSCQAHSIVQLRERLAVTRREVKQLSGQRLRVRKQVKYKGLGPVGVKAVALAFWCSGERAKTAAVLAYQLALRCRLRAGRTYQTQHLYRSS